MRVGVLGGTFDPIHVGHLDGARAAQSQLHLDRVRFIPSAQPPHRPDTPRASGYHRLQMAKLATATTPGWEVSDLELQRSGPSYTFDTLVSLHREGLDPSQVFFIIGTDAFAEITTWYRYPEVLDAAHFAVVARPGTTLETVRARLPNIAPRMIEPEDLVAGPPTRVVFIQADTRNVSATDIRQRAMRGESIRDLVPAAVAAYIEQNLLYRTAPHAPHAPQAP